MKRFEIFFGIVRVPIDILMTILAFLAAYELRLLTSPIEGFAKPIDITTLPTSEQYLVFSLKAAALLFAIFILGKMYSLKTTFKFSTETKKITILCAVWAMAIITYFFFVRTFPFSRLAMFYSWSLTLIFIFLGRAAVRLLQTFFFKMGIGKRTLLFIGKNKISADISAELSKNPSYKILETFDEDKISQLEYFLKKNHVDEIIQTKTDHSQEVLELCDLYHINYRFVPDLIEVRKTNVGIETIGNVPVISLKPTPLDGWGKVAKRILDTLGAAIGLIILSPVFIITAVAIKIDSKGPIIFSKLDDGSPVRRVGQHGKLFKFYKFRSMLPNTDKLRYTELAKNNIRTDGPLVKIANDPRITKVGKFIRKYSIDELPQLWNVIKGNMSLVGPRPHLPEEVAKYKNHHRFVLTIKPGLTGLAQIRGRSDLSFEDEVKLDRFYIENWTIWLDMKIIFKTIGIILKGYRE